MKTYQVLQRLCEGSAADVFLAHAPGSGRQVLVEVLRPEFVKDDSLITRFVSAARLRRGFAHPNVTRLAKLGRLRDGRPFCITEPFDGASLRAQLDGQGPLGLSQLLKLMIPVCEALGYLHERGLVHGNLKSELIFLNGGLESSSPKVFEPGLSLLRTQAETRRVLVLPQHLSPERIRGKRAGPAADVYALGLLMHELATGSTPFGQGSTEEIKRQHLEDPPPALPESFRALVSIRNRCLEKLPEQRYATASEVSAALQGLLAAPVGDKLTFAPARLHATCKPGDTLGPFQLEDLLGKGAMGHVYRARHTRLERKVAIKVLRPELTENEALVQRFFQEARAANQIQHEHIVEIYDFVEEQRAQGAVVYCVLELLSGQTLEQLLREGPLPLSRGLGIAHQICCALDAAHRAGVLHRDLKPENVFLVQKESRPDFVKVVDFGIAKLRSPTGQPIPHLPQLTVRGMMLGTPSYMAPEQATGKPTDPRTDIYALGTVLYRMVSGDIPFRGQTLRGQIFKLLNEEPPALPDVTPAGEPLPPALRALILRCLAKKPEERPRSMAAVGGALSRLLHGEETAALRQPVAAPRPVEIPQPVTQAGEAPAPQRSWISSHRRAAAFLLLLATGGTLLAIKVAGGRPEPSAQVVAEPAPEAPVADEPQLSELPRITPTRPELMPTAPTAPIPMAEPKWVTKAKPSTRGAGVRRAPAAPGSAPAARPATKDGPPEGMDRDDIIDDPFAP